MRIRKMLRRLGCRLGVHEWVTIHGLDGAVAYVCLACGTRL